MKKLSYFPITTRLYLSLAMILQVILISSGMVFAQSAPRIFINEFLAANLSTNPDMVDFGDFSDWVELYNDESVNVSIGGFYLTDDLTQPRKWQIPTNTIIPAKGYYLVWADGYNDVPGKTYVRNWWPDNTTFVTKWCHTNFKLNKDGDEIGLFDAGGNKLDSVVFSNQVFDVSYGRKPDGSNNWFYFAEPTPLASNASAGINNTNVSANVDFSVEGGFYQSPFQVALNSSSGNGVLRYTTDGSIPKSTSTQYISPISINTNTVLRARVFENSKLPGKITTNSYFINETRNLPAASYVADPKFLWDRQVGIYLNSYRDRQIPVSLEYFPLGSGRAFFLDAGSRIGGENIYRFAEKPLNIYTSADYGFPHFLYRIFDDLPFTKYKRLYLRNGGDDWPITMFRDGLQENILKHQISNAMQDFKPSVLYLNGNYWGIYNLREKIDEEYFLLHYDIDPKDLDHLEDDYSVITGDSTDFVNLLNFAYGNNLADSSNYDYVVSKIDVYDLMDFIIANDYVANSSWGHNRETWRDSKNEKLWHWVLVDMDRGFDAARISANQLDDLYNNFRLFRELCRNDKFKNTFVQRYSERLNHTFNEDRVLPIIDSLKSLIQNEMPRHVQKWGTYIDSLTIDIWGKTPGITSMNSWNSEVQNLKNFAVQRTNYAIQHLNSRFGLSGRANLKISSNVQGQGKVIVNSFYEDLGESNLYFKNVPLRITAYPPPGYRFKQWDKVGLAAEVNLITAGASWKYRDAGSGPDNSWKNLDYDDTGWKTGNAQFGYGDGDETTVIDYGPDDQNKYITSYYRKSFQIDDPANVKELSLKLLRDDGAVVYLNGNEVVRDNMPAGTVNYSTYAVNAIGGTDETTFFDFTVDNTNLVAGKNVIAVEIHQSSGTSSDVSFDLSLDASLNQQSQVGQIISTQPTINFTLTGDAELTMEFERIGGDVPTVLNTPLILSKSGSPYFITNDLNIESNGILTVEPGVVIYSSSGRSIYVRGKLLMEGTEAEPIAVMPYYSNENWGAICFDESNGTSELNYVNITGATNGADPINFFAAVSSLSSTVHLTHVSFNNVELPVSSQFSNMMIDNCRFENVTYVGDYVNCTGGNLSILNSVFIGNDIEDMDAIDLGDMNAATEIKNNIFRDFTGGNSDGIDLGEHCVNVDIESNLISNCFDKGVSVGAGSDAILSHNIIASCGMGVGIKDSMSYAEINNCTFYNNTIGVDCFEKVLNRGGGNASIKNSVFAKSIQAPYLIDDESRITISYSLSNTSALPGQGNLLAEPLMIDPGGLNFHLQTGSPCIDKGDPQSSPDADGSRTDIGAFMYAGVSGPDVVINEINYNSSKGFDPGDWIELCNATKGAVDISGWVIMDENRTPSFAIKPGTILQPGSYIVICIDSKLFKQLFPNVTNYQGDMRNGLSGGGEILFLYDTSGRLVDSVTYDNKSPWPTGPDGGGSTLELKNPGLENSSPANWAASSGHGTPGAINSDYVTGVKEEKSNLIPTAFLLKQNYPNPFNPSTKITFEIPEHSTVSLTVYNILGKKVAEITKAEFSPGVYSIDWNGSSLASGIYFLKMNARATSGRNYDAVKKLILLK